MCSAPLYREAAVRVRVVCLDRDLAAGRVLVRAAFFTPADKPPSKVFTKIPTQQ